MKNIVPPASDPELMKQVAKVRVNGPADGRPAVSLAGVPPLNRVEEWRGAASHFGAGATLLFQMSRNSSQELLLFFQSTMNLP